MKPRSEVRLPELPAALREPWNAVASTASRSVVQCPPFLDRLEVYQNELPSDAARAIDQLAAKAILTPFQRRQWLACWQRHVGDPSGRKAVTVIGYRSSRAVIVLPFSFEHRLFLKKLSWRADDLNDYCGPLIDRQFAGLLHNLDMNLLFRAAAESIGGADLLYLQKQPQQLGGYHNPFAGRPALAYRAGCHSTALSPDWDSYFKSKRSPRTRRRLKEKFNALSKFGPVDIRIANSVSEATHLVEVCLAMKAVQLRRLNHSDPFQSAGAKALLIDYFGRRIADDTWVAALHVASEPVAIAFGFRDRDSWLLYQTAMTDGRFGNLSPGTHLLIHLLKFCCEAGVKEFDFSLGDESYKADWCERKSQLMTAIVPLSPVGTLFGLYFRAKANFANWLASSPILYELARRLKGRMMRMRYPR